MDAEVGADRVVGCVFVGGGQTAGIMGWLNMMDANYGRLACDYNHYF